LTPTRIRREAASFLRAARNFTEMSRKKFLSSVGISPQALLAVIPYREWRRMKSERLRELVIMAMDEVYRGAHIRRDFSSKKICELAGVCVDTLRSLASDEYQKRSLSLPTAREKILQTLEEMVEANTPLEELTILKLFERAGHAPDYGKWLADPLREARKELKRRQKSQPEPLQPQNDPDILVLPEGNLDLNSDTWHLKKINKHIRRERLRSDIALVAWPILREELRRKKLAQSTISGQYMGFIYAADMLSAEVPNLHTAKARAVQRAWIAYGGTYSQRIHTRYALIQLMTSLTDQANTDSSIDGSEMRKILAWLRLRAKVPGKRSCGDFLNEDELSELIRCCLTDIQRGLEHVAARSHPRQAAGEGPRADNSDPIIDWAIALMILVTAFTGLRPQSVVGLEVNDWMQLRRGLAGVAWKHTKKLEENVALIPSIIAQLIDHYIYHTGELRQTLGTRRVFLCNDSRGDWCVYSTKQFRIHLKKFAERHRILREGGVIPLTPTMLKRTYSTHQLHLGRPLEFVQAQFGHSRIDTTERYAQFDRYEHPARVQNALDEYGRAVLDLWREPVLLEALEPEGRRAIFQPRDEAAAAVDVHETATGVDIPCWLCEMLMTGADYLPAWEEELARREGLQEPGGLSQNEGSLPAREKAGMNDFMENFGRLKKGVAGE
jgi:integrase